jgi:hypothetical protein
VDTYAGAQLGERFYERVSQRAGFRVMTLTEPYRVVIDVARVTEASRVSCAPRYVCTAAGWLSVG